MDTHKHTHWHLLECAHCLIMHVHTGAAYFTKLKNTLSLSLSVPAWRAHTFSHRSANDILSHTYTHTGMIASQHCPGSARFSDWHTGQRCPVCQGRLHGFKKNNEVWIKEWVFSKKILSRFKCSADVFFIAVSFERILLSVKELK